MPPCGAAPNFSKAHVSSTIVEDPPDGVSICAKYCGHWIFSECRFVPESCAHVYFLWRYTFPWALLYTTCNTFRAFTSFEAHHKAISDLEHAQFLFCLTFGDIRMQLTMELRAERLLLLFDTVKKSSVGASCSSGFDLTSEVWRLSAHFFVNIVSYYGLARVFSLSHGRFVNILLKVFWLFRGPVWLAWTFALVSSSWKVCVLSFGRVVCVYQANLKPRSTPRSRSKSQKGKETRRVSKSPSGFKTKVYAVSILQQPLFRVLACRLIARSFLCFASQHHLCLPDTSARTLLAQLCKNIFVHTFATFCSSVKRIFADESWTGKVAHMLASFSRVVAIHLSQAIYFTWVKGP